MRQAVDGGGTTENVPVGLGVAIHEEGAGVSTDRRRKEGGSYRKRNVKVVVQAVLRR